MPNPSGPNNRANIIFMPKANAAANILSVKAIEAPDIIETEIDISCEHSKKYLDFKFCPECGTEIGLKEIQESYPEWYENLWDDEEDLSIFEDFPYEISKINNLNIKEIEIKNKIVCLRPEVYNIDGISIIGFLINCTSNCEEVSLVEIDDLYDKIKLVKEELKKLDLLDKGKFGIWLIREAG